MGDAPVTIALNGRPREIAPGTTVAGLLHLLSLPDTRVAVEHNNRILRKPAFDATTLSPGDRVEIVSLVGGG